MYKIYSIMARGSPWLTEKRRLIGSEMKFSNKWVFASLWKRRIELINLEGNFMAYMTY